MKGRVFCTSITSNYLSFILPLRRSLINSGNEEELFVLVADHELKPLSEDIPGIKFISLKDLSSEIVDQMTIYFGPGELANSLKPFCIEYILNLKCANEVIFIDCDLFFTSKLPNLFENHDARKLLLFTPHITKTCSITERVPKEIDIVDMGILNGGFIAVKHHARTFEILNWLKERFAYFGFDDRKNGYFLDQKLLPLLLTIFPEEVGIEFSESLNVAFWNSHERNVYIEDGNYFIEKKSPVIFFHMSGVKKNCLDSEICIYLSKEENLKIIERAPWIQNVLKDYLKNLNQFNSLPSWPYKYTTYNNINLFPEIRRYYFKNRKLSLTHHTVKLIIIHRLKLINRFLRKNFKPW